MDNSRQVCVATSSLESQYFFSKSFTGSEVCKENRRVTLKELPPYNGIQISNTIIQMYPCSSGGSGLGQTEGSCRRRPLFFSFWHVFFFLCFFQKSANPILSTFASNTFYFFLFYFYSSKILDAGLLLVVEQLILWYCYFSTTAVFCS